LQADTALLSLPAAIAAASNSYDANAIRVSLLDSDEDKPLCKGDVQDNVAQLAHGYRLKAAQALAEPATGACISEQVFKVHNGAAECTNLAAP
jgi:hypothetical protein